MNDEGIGPREQTRRETMRRIREAAVEYFLTREYDEVSTRAIAQHARIGEATLFRYVATKQDLLMLAYGEQMEGFIEDIEARDRATAIEGSHHGEHYTERVLDVYHARSRFYLRNPVNAAMYMRLNFEVHNVYQGDQIITLCAGIVSAGQSAGALIATVDPTLVALNCNGIFIHEVDRTPTRGFSPDSIWERVRARLSTQLDPLIVRTD